MSSKTRQAIGNTDFYKYFDKLVSYVYARATLAIFSDNPLTMLCCSCQNNKILNNFVLFYLPYLSSIYGKANCIAIYCTESPHSLGNCFFRGVLATCLPHKGGGVPLSALPKDTTSELAGLFSTTSSKCQAPSKAGNLQMPFFEVFWYYLTRGMNTRSTGCEADALTTTPSRRFQKLLGGFKLLTITVKCLEL